MRNPFALTQLANGGIHYTRRYLHLPRIHFDDIRYTSTALIIQDGQALKSFHCD